MAEQGTSTAQEGAQGKNNAVEPDIIDAGRAAIEPAAGEPATSAAHDVAQARKSTTPDNEAPSPAEPPTSPPQRPRLRDTAAALLACSDATTEREPLADAVASLRASLGPVRSAAAPRTPRQGTKQEAVLTLLRRPEGATIASVVAATGWAQHTVRGFFAHLKKNGHTVEVLERVRQVGAGSTGAKGSYSIYRLAEAG